MEGGRRAVCATDGDKNEGAGEGHPHTLTSMANLANGDRECKGHPNRVPLDAAFCTLFTPQ
jgi:hypothetical protein